MTSVVSQRSAAIGLSIAGIGLIVAGSIWWSFLNAADVSRRARAADLSAVPVRVEFEAPQLSLSDLHQNTSSLIDFRGQVVLVNLWATWCPPCEFEMPIYQEFFDEHRGAGFAVVAINDGEAPGVVRRFVDYRSLTFPVWLDPEYRATEVAFRTANLPTSYLIDRSGVVRLMWIGAIDKPTLEAYVAPLIKE